MARRASLGRAFDRIKLGPHACARTGAHQHHCAGIEQLRVGAAQDDEVLCVYPIVDCTIAGDHAIEIDHHEAFADKLRGFLGKKFEPAIAAGKACAVGIGQVCEV